VVKSIQLSVDCLVVAGQHSQCGCEDAARQPGRNRRFEIRASLPTTLGQLSVGVAGCRKQARHTVSALCLGSLRRAGLGCSNLDWRGEEESEQVTQPAPCDVVVLVLLGRVQILLPLITGNFGIRGCWGGVGF
jgi:hypothetical protein